MYQELTSKRLNTTWQAGLLKGIDWAIIRNDNLCGRKWSFSNNISHVEINGVKSYIYPDGGVEEVAGGIGEQRGGGEGNYEEAELEQLVEHCFGGLHSAMTDDSEGMLFCKLIIKIREC